MTVLNFTASTIKFDFFSFFMTFRQKHKFNSGKFVLVAEQLIIQEFTDHLI